MLKDLFSKGLDITLLVDGEITRHRNALDTAIRDGWIRVQEVSIDHVKRYQKSYPNLDTCESASIILARDWNATFLSDDGAAKSFACDQANIPRVLDTLDLLLEMESAGILQKEEIQEMISEMEDRADFVYSAKRYEEFLVQYNKT